MADDDWPVQYIKVQSMFYLIAVYPIDIRKQHCDDYETRT
jgi:hypothetical protein